MQNKSISIVIADDDPVQLEFLCSLTQKLRPEWDIVGTASSAEEAKALIADFAPSLCLLDIEMNDASGIEVASAIEGASPVIFVTGHAAYAVEAFNCAAMDFVVKPVRPERLETAFKRAEQALSNPTSHGLSVPTKSGTTPSMVRFLRGRDMLMASLDDICYFQAQHKYTRVVLENTEGLLRMNLTAALQHLDPQRFWRVHRSYIVNAEHILSSNRDDINRIVLKIKGRTEKLIVSKPYEHLFSKDGFS